jgi:hypothetical protein
MVGCESIVPDAEHEVGGHRTCLSIISRSNWRPEPGGTINPKVLGMPTAHMRLVKSSVPIGKDIFYYSLLWSYTIHTTSILPVIRQPFRKNVVS